jgi:hypothetical protein
VLWVGDNLNAYGAYETAAAELYYSTVDEEPDGTTCKDDLGKVKDKRRNPELNVGFERPRTDNNNDWPSLFSLYCAMMFQYIFKLVIIIYFFVN